MSNTTHRDNEHVLQIIARWPVMWRQSVDGVGRLTCYGAPGCVVHFMDYEDGGWDVYTPPHRGPELAPTLDALRCVDTTVHYYDGSPSQKEGRSP